MTDTAHEHDNLPMAALAAAMSQLDQELAHGQARIAELRARSFAALRELRNARAVASDLSWELADVEQRLRELQEQREVPGDTLLEREIASIAAKRAALEEQVLGQMLLVDELVASATAEERALAAEERGWATHEAELTNERNRISMTLDRAAQDRASA